MNSIFQQLTVFDSYTVLLLTDGNGVLEIDFKKHSLSAGKAIFLTPGQYVQKLSGDLIVESYEFQGNPLEQVENARYLFKHLVSLGYVEMTQRENLESGSLNALELGRGGAEMLDTAVADWLELNPFKASIEEIEVLFDLKEFIDKHYHEQPGLDQVAQGLSQHGQYLRRLTKSRLASTVNQMLHKKLLDEAQRQVVFTDKSTKELAYDLGFAYPSYFNRFFKQQTAQTPGAFRDHFGVQLPDQFRGDFSTLLDEHFREQRFLAFYADEMYLSVKNLSAKIKSSFGVGFNELLNQRLISKGRSLLATGENVTETAYSLGFKEPNHFSSFFKKHTGASPMSYLTQ